MVIKSTSVEELWHRIIRTFRSDLETSNTVEQIPKSALELHRRALPSVDEYRRLLEEDYKTMYGDWKEADRMNTRSSGRG